MLAITGILALCLAAALPLFADEVQDVKAMLQAAPIGAEEAAWSSGLDLRDAQNHPISRDALRRGLKAGSQRELEQASGLSGLGGLAALLAYLERLGLDAVLRRESDAPAPEAMSAVQPLKPPKIAAAGAGPAVATPSGPARVRLSPLQLSFAPGRLSPLPLRC